MGRTPRTPHSGGEKPPRPARFPRGRPLGLQRVLEEKFGQSGEKIVSILCDLVAHSDPKVKLDAIKLVLQYQVGMPVQRVDHHGDRPSMLPAIIIQTYAQPKMGVIEAAPQLPAPVVTEIPEAPEPPPEPVMEPLPGPAFDIVEAMPPEPPPPVFTVVQPPVKRKRGRPPKRPSLGPRANG